VAGWDPFAKGADGVNAVGEVKQGAVVETKDGFEVTRGRLISALRLQVKGVVFSLHPLARKE
jgi:hypothetical protein